MLLLSPTKEPYCYEADEVTQMQKASLLFRMLRPNKKEINHRSMNKPNDQKNPHRPTEENRGYLKGSLWTKAHGK